MRRFRFRWFVVGVILAAGLYLALDVVTLRYLESRGATQIARAMTAEEARLDLGDVPFLPGFLTGRISRVEVDVRGASAGDGLRIESVRARMNDVSVGWRSLLSLSRSLFSTRTTVEMSDPIGIVEIVQDDLGDLLRRQVPMVESVVIESSGIEVRFLEEPLEPGARPTQEDLTEPARLLPRIVDGRVVLSLVGVAQIPEELRDAAERLEMTLTLPRIPEGLRTDVRLGHRVVVLEATGTELELTIGEGEET